MGYTSQMCVVWAGSPFSSFFEILDSFFLIFCRGCVLDGMLITSMLKYVEVRVPRNTAPFFQPITGPSPVLPRPTETPVPESGSGPFWSHGRVWTVFPLLPLRVFDFFRFFLFSFSTSATQWIRFSSNEHVTSKKQIFHNGPYLYHPCMVCLPTKYHKDQPFMYRSIYRSSHGCYGWDIPLAAHFFVAKNHRTSASRVENLNHLIYQPEVTPRCFQGMCFWTKAKWFFLVFCWGFKNKNAWNLETWIAWQLTKKKEVGQTWGT